MRSRDPAGMVAVTGANGFVGRAVVQALVASGRTVLALVRSVPPAASTNPVYRTYELDVPTIDLLDGVSSVVHCAFARALPHRSGSYDRNVRGTLKLFEHAVERSCTFAFVSSLSALPGALSEYGRQKFHLERVLLERGACVIRPGLVIGDGGLVRNMLHTMSKFHVMPLVDGGRQLVQYIGLGEVASVIRILVERGLPSGSVTAAARDPITVARLGRDLRRRFGLQAFPVSMPYGFAFPIVAAAEGLGLRAAALDGKPAWHQGFSGSTGDGPQGRLGSRPAILGRAPR